MEHPRPTRNFSGPSLLSNAGMSLLGQSSQQLASLVMTLLAAAVLSVADYGLYALAIVIVEFAVLFAHAGFFGYLIAAKEDDAPLISTMFWTILGVGCCSGVALFAMAAPLAHLFDVGALTVLLQTLAVLQPFGAVTAWASARLMRDGHMRRYYLILCQGNLTSMTAGMVVLIIWPSVYALLAYRVIRVGLNLILFLRASPIPKTRVFEFRLFCKACRFARGLYVARVAEYFTNFGADLMLAYLFSTTESGLFRLANRLAVASTDIFVIPLRSFATKSFAMTARQDGKMSPQFAHYLAAGIVFIGGACAVIFTLGPAAITEIFGPEYQGVTWVMSLLALRAFFLWPHHLIEPVLAARHRPNVVMIYNLLWLMVALVCILAFAPMGIEVLALSQSVFALLAAFSALFTLQKWGEIDLHQARQQARSSLKFLCGYGGVVLLVWSISRSFEPIWSLFFGVTGSVVFAVFAIHLAVSRGALKLSVFSSR